MVKQWFELISSFSLKQKSQHWGDSERILCRTVEDHKMYSEIVQIIIWNYGSLSSGTFCHRVWETKL